MGSSVHGRAQVSNVYKHIRSHQQVQRWPAPCACKGEKSPTATATGVGGLLSAGRIAALCIRGRVRRMTGSVGAEKVQPAEPVMAHMPEHVPLLLLLLAQKG